MDLNDEVITVIKEISALKVVVLKLGEVIDRIEDGHGSLIREAQEDLQKVEATIIRIKEKLGMFAEETVMGDKVTVTGSEITGAQVGTGGQKNSSPDWLKYLVWGAIIIASLALAGSLGIQISTDWFSVNP